MSCPNFCPAHIFISVLCKTQYILMISIHLACSLIAHVFPPPLLSSCHFVLLFFLAALINNYNISSNLLSCWIFEQNFEVFTTLLRTWSRNECRHFLQPRPLQPRVLSLCRKLVQCSAHQIFVCNCC